MIMKLFMHDFSVMNLNLGFSIMNFSLVLTEWTVQSITQLIWFRDIFNTFFLIYFWYKRLACAAFVQCLYIAKVEKYFIHAWLHKTCYIVGLCLEQTNVL